MRIAGAGALVAGGASGLGEAVARRLHADGAQVLVVDRDGARAAALAAELGARADAAASDVGDAEQVAAAVRRAVAGPGGLRVAVNCAGVGWAERVVARDGPHALDAFERVVRINLVGTFNVLRLAAAAMLEAPPLDEGERGVIVNTASIAAFDGQMGQAAYAASKGGVVGLTLPAARDLAPGGVRVCAIAPGLFDTPLLGGLPDRARNALALTIPFPHRLGHPQEFARLVAEIVANPMLNGETIRLDGALRMAPR